MFELSSLVPAEQSSAVHGRPGSSRWSLEDLIDFEQACSVREPGTVIPEALRREIRESTQDLAAVAARRIGLRCWLEYERESARRPAEADVASSCGRSFVRALGLASALLAAVAFAVGIGSVFGLLDRPREGIHAVWFLALTLGSQFLILLATAAAFLFRRRVGDGFSFVQGLVGQVARRMAGTRRPRWWDQVTGSASSQRKALLWPLARVTQEAAVAFNLGLITGLASLVLFRHTGFYWESTTESALQHALQQGVGVLASPWRWLLPDCIPDIPATRWRPGDSAAGFREHARGWWTFLLLAITVWGLLPRMMLRFAAIWLGRRALARLEFQERHHRALWRDLTEVGRGENREGPADGVLVIDLGGSGIRPETLQPFLLRRLRVHPVAWHPFAVLDPDHEAEVRAALARSPAGVVVVAEAWALAPARLRHLHSTIRAAAGSQVPVVFLVVNPGPDSTPLPPSPEERLQWERCIDALADPATETVAFAPIDH